MAGKNSDEEVIFRPWITVKGKRVYAWQYGLRAFPIKVKKGGRKK